MAPIPDALLSRIEDAGLNASAPPQQRWIDGWLVRFSPATAKRARCINAVADGRLPLPERLALCQTLYREAGLPLVLRVTPFSRPAGLDDWLAGRDMQRINDTRVMVARTLPGRIAAPPKALRLERLADADFADHVGRLRDSPRHQRRAHAQRLKHLPVRHEGWGLRGPQDGALVACGLLAVEADLVGLYDVFTRPAERNQGLAHQLCAALLARARGLGARVGYLQVEAANAAAQAVYRGLGFVDGYAYHYRTAQDAAQ